MARHMDLEPQIHGLAPEGFDWHVDPAEEIWAKRVGFPIRPDFASTVHTVTGNPLETDIADLGGFGYTRRWDDALKRYISLSRVQGPDRILIAQLFLATLLMQGPLWIAVLITEFMTKLMRRLVTSMLEEVKPK